MLPVQAETTRLQAYTKQTLRKLSIVTKSTLHPLSTFPWELSSNLECYLLLSEKKYHNTVCFMMLGQPKLCESRLKAQAIIMNEKANWPANANMMVAITLPAHASKITCRPPKVKWVSKFEYRRNQ